LVDVPANEKVVVFCLFKRDLEAILRASRKAGRNSWELSGDRNDLESWYNFDDGDVLAVQIQAGAEGIDLTQARYGIYYNLPHSLAQYEQSLARLYRPGQTQDVRFTYILARDTIDEDIFESLQMKTDIITRVQQDELDFKFLK
jgi:SNF2 family DNA or RNA helicase